MSPHEVAALYVSHNPGLVRFILSKVRGDAAEAPDLAQATWAHFCAVTASRTVSEPVHFLFRVAKHKAAKHRRFRARKGRLLREDLSEDSPILTPVSGTWRSRRGLTDGEAKRPARGEKHGCARYADALLTTLRIIYARTGSLRATAREADVPYPTVRRFLKGIRKTT